MGNAIINKIKKTINRKINCRVKLGMFMEILNIKVLKGANYWSNLWKKLIVIELDLKKHAHVLSNHIPHFSEKLIKLLPSLEQHYCAKGQRGGFLQLLKEGADLAHVTEHIAVELQALAGMACSYSQTRSTINPKIYNIIYTYEIETAGLYAAKVTVELIKSIVENAVFTPINDIILSLKQIQSQEDLSASAKALLSAALARNIPIMELKEEGVIMLGQGCKQKFLAGSLTSQTSCIGVDLTVDKIQTKHILQAAHLITPPGFSIRSIASLNHAITDIGFPLTIKPVDSQHGKGVTTNILTAEQAKQALKYALTISSHVIIEKYIQGQDFRFLVVNYELVAVAQRLPVCLIANGISTIKELIDDFNRDSLHDGTHETILSKINLDDSSAEILKEHGFTTETILPKDYKLSLKYSIDVTEKVDPQNKLLAERVARLFHLDVCGIDMIIERLDLPLTEKNGAIIEVVPAPELQMHLNPSIGLSHNVAKNILDMFYPVGTVCRIPLIAVSRIDEKTIIPQLLAYFAQHTGYCVGYSNAGRVYIDNQFICQVDPLSTPAGKIILRDPLVNFAILECQHLNILNSGLDFDHCFISIITHSSMVSEALNPLNTVVAQSTLREGYAILNADDEAVYSLKDEINCHVALFSLYANNPRIQNHILNEGMCAYVDGNELIIHHQSNILRLDNLCHAPETIPNLIPAVLAGLLCNIPHQDIANCLNELAINSAKMVLPE